MHLQDTTFEMERQRNKPVKYNRELVHKSVKAMQKVEEVCFASGYCSFALHTLCTSFYTHLHRQAYIFSRFQLCVVECKPG